MAMSYLGDSEAPQDFRISSIESDGHYTKCILCCTVKRNFYCPDCVKGGDFVHSSVPFSDRFYEKQRKLTRMKINKQLIQERCENLLLPKLKKDIMLTESKQSRDKLNLLTLAIEQRRGLVDAKRKELKNLKVITNEIRLKLPRYQKRVSSLGKHAQDQRMELQKIITRYQDQTHALAALRRSRIRQLTRYIFPIYMSYDASDSFEDLQFVNNDAQVETPKRMQLHIVAPWIDIDYDYKFMQSLVDQSKELVDTSESRCGAALGLSAQLVALLAWTLDIRLPHAIVLSEYSEARNRRGCVAQVRAGAAALCARAGVCPAPAPAPLAPLVGLHTLALAAVADDPELGSVEQTGRGGEWDEAWGGAGAAWLAAADADPDEPEPPEHLHWPDTAQIAEVASSPPPPAASLVSSAAASLASIWRGWTH